MKIKYFIGDLAEIKDEAEKWMEENAVSISVVNTHIVRTDSIFGDFCYWIEYKVVTNYIKAEELKEYNEYIRRLVEDL